MAHVEPFDVSRPVAPPTEHPLVVVGFSEGAGLASQPAEKPCLGAGSHEVAGVMPLGPTLAATLRFVALG